MQCVTDRERVEAVPGRRGWEDCYVPFDTLLLGLDCGLDVERCQ